MKALSRAVFPGAPPRPIRVLQIGDGVFLRGFADWMIDVANEKGLASFGVAVALARSHAKPPKLLEQDCLYTLLERGLVNGEPYEARRIVSAIEMAFDPHRDPETLRKLAASTDLRFVISNTTEAGIVDAPEPYVESQCPRSFPAKVAWLLKARFDALGGEDAPGLIFLPTELIDRNGRTLRAYALSAAERWGFGPAFQDWVDRRCVFADTLVDRIVPGFPAAEAEALFDAWGYSDPLAIMGEPFHLWVIEGDFAEAWPLREAGLNVVWTGDVTPYRDLKIRMLNGVHTATALPAFLAGLDIVGHAVADPQFSRYIETLMFREIAPHVDLPAAEREAYGRSVLDRFRNPYLRHELLSISLNSISKWNARLKPVLKLAVAREGAVPELIAFSFAALLWFYRGVGERPYPLRDEEAALALFANAWASAHSVSEIVSGLMADTRLWGEDLSFIPGFAEAVQEAISDIKTLGVRGALSRRGC